MKTSVAQNSNSSVPDSSSDLTTFKPDPHEVEKLSQEIQHLYDGLVNNNDNINVISEDDFVSGFLPYFAGELNIADNKDFVGLWIGIAGAPSNEVAVVDKNYNELYRVPALMNTGNIVPRNDGAFAQLMDEYNSRGSQIPALGDAFLKEEVTHISKDLDNSIQKNKDDEVRWLEIFKRYHKTLPQNVRDNKEIILDDEEDVLDYD